MVTYALLTGRLPFTVEPFKISSLYKKMVNGEMNHVPSSLSKNCRDFISRVLTANPEKRPTVDEIINHRWLKEALDYRFVVELFQKKVWMQSVFLPQKPRRSWRPRQAWRDSVILNVLRRAKFSIYLVFLISPRLKFWTKKAKIIDGKNN